MRLFLRLEFAEMPVPQCLHRHNIGLTIWLYCPGTFAKNYKTKRYYEKAYSS